MYNKLFALSNQVEHEVLIQIHKWEKETGRQFNMGGMPFDEFVRRQHEEYTVGKENEKMQRVTIVDILQNCCWSVDFCFCDCFELS